MAGRGGGGGVSWSDLDEATRTRLLEGNPELAAEVGAHEEQEAREAARKRPPVDPEVEALRAQAEAVRQNTLDLRVQSGLVRAEAQLLTQQTALRRAQLAIGDQGRNRGAHGRHGRGRGRHRFGFLQTALFLFPLAYVAVLLAGGLEK